MSDINDLARTPAQFLFEVGYGACWAEAFVRNDGKPPFELSDDVIERAWSIAGEAHDDHAEFDRYLALANATPPAPSDGLVERAEQFLRERIPSDAPFWSDDEAHGCDRMQMLHWMAEFTTSAVPNGHVVVPREAIDSAVSTLLAIRATADTGEMDGDACFHFYNLCGNEIAALNSMLAAAPSSPANGSIVASEGEG